MKDNRETNESGVADASRLRDFSRKFEDGAICSVVKQHSPK
jgi:hypothetical protein